MLTIDHSKHKYLSMISEINRYMFGCVIVVDTHKALIL